MSLRRSFVALLALMTIPALIAAVALVAMTTLLHDATRFIEASVESVRAAEETQIAILEHERTRDVVARVAAEGNARRQLATAERFVVSPEEKALIGQAAENVEAYFVAVRRGDDSVQALDAAYETLERLIELNVAQSRAATVRAERVDRVANLIGFGIAAQLVAATVIAGIWLRRHIMQPVASLAGTIERFASGDRTVKAPDDGPAELRAIAREFNGLASALEHQRERQLTFLAAIAHDLRNPLSAMRYALAAMDSNKTAALLGRQLDRMERLVGDLQDTAHIEAGHFELRPEPCDVREVVRDTCSLFSEASSLHAVRAVLPGMPVVVDADVPRLAQVLNNLVSNAVKYSPDGGNVVVAVTAEDGAAVILVSDEGVGILPSDRDRIFEPFRRGAQNRSIPGVGLGLSVAKKIVEAHHGTIGFESHPGATTFRITLPLHAKIQARVDH